jgi:hypothetical protein
MELKVEEVADDIKTKYRCELCDYNPYQEWCKGNVARFHIALQNHLQTKRHRNNEAIAKGEVPPNQPPPSHYISKLEWLIDKLETRIASLCAEDEPPLPLQKQSKEVRRFEWKGAERKAMMDVFDCGLINMTNVYNALTRCKDWCETLMTGDKLKKNVSYLLTTRDVVKHIMEMLGDGWQPEEEVLETLSNRLDAILTHQFVV